MNDWKAQAEREAAALIASTGTQLPIVTHDYLVSLLAVAWLQGVNLGSHETLSLVEQAFTREQAEL